MLPKEETTSESTRSVGTLNSLRGRFVARARCEMRQKQSVKTFRSHLVRDRALGETATHFRSKLVAKSRRLDGFSPDVENGVPCDRTRFHFTLESRVESGLRGGELLCCVCSLSIRAGGRMRCRWDGGSRPTRKGARVGGDCWPASPATER